MERYNQNLNSNYDPIYVNEQILPGHGNPISIEKLNDYCKRAKNSICKIQYFGNGTGFFFQQNIPNIQYYKKNFLMTNNHVLNDDFIKNNVELLIEFKKKDRNISLNNRIKYTNQELDFTIIEILSEDPIFKEITFLKIDDYILNNGNESEYSKEDICIIQFPQGKELAFDKGEIKSINDYTIEHLVSTDFGSSGSPILLLKNFKVIGIHNKRGIDKRYNKGIFMKNILYTINDINKIKLLIPPKIIDFTTTTFPYKNELTDINSNNKNNKNRIRQI